MPRMSAPAQTTETRLKILTLTTAAMLCFSANSILCRLALGPRLVDAATFTSVRVVSAAAMLCIAICWRRRGFPSFERANPLSIIALFAYFIFFSFAYLRLDAGSGALVLIGA